MGLLNKDDLDHIEKEYIKALKRETECAAATISEMYRLLTNNGRLLISVATDGDSDYLEDMDEESKVILFPDRV